MRFSLPLTIQVVAWNVVASFQAELFGKTRFYICRWLLGLLEGGEYSTSTNMVINMP